MRGLEPTFSMVIEAQSWACGPWIASASKSSRRRSELRHAALKKFACPILPATRGIEKVHMPIILVAYKIQKAHGDDHRHWRSIFKKSEARRSRTLLEIRVWSGSENHQRMQSAQKLPKSPQTRQTEHSSMSFHVHFIFTHDRNNCVLSADLEPHEKRWSTFWKHVHLKWLRWNRASSTNGLRKVDYNIREIHSAVFFVSLSISWSWRNMTEIVRSWWLSIANGWDWKNDHAWMLRWLTKLDHTSHHFISQPGRNLLMFRSHREELRNRILTSDFHGAMVWHAELSQSRAWEHPLLFQWRNGTVCLTREKWNDRKNTWIQSFNRITRGVFAVARPF